MLPPLFFSVRLPTLLAMFWRRCFLRNGRSGGSQRAPISYIVFRLDAMGDVVLTTPLFRALKSMHPKSRLTVVVQRQIKPLLVTNPYIDEILTLPSVEPQWLSMRLQRLLAAILLYCAQLRGRHFEFAISPRWDVDEHLATFLCALVNAAHRVGYTCATTADKHRINRGFDRVYDVCLPPGPICHEVQRNIAVAQCLGAGLHDTDLEIHITERDRRRAAELLANVAAETALIAVGIGARSPGRRWPLERFAETVNRIGATRNIQPLIVCSAVEHNEALRLKRLLRMAPMIISGALLREVCAVLERCEVFIGNDSGCAHLAAAVGCRTVVISRHPRDGNPNHFNSPVRFAPHTSNVKVLQPATGRDGCTEACVVPGPHCILEVSAEDAASSALGMLEAQAAEVVTRASRRSAPLPCQLLHAHSGEAIRLAAEALRSNFEGPSL
jgi:ADP-heptose:LPS heptosyltransferase